jgi:hypothetical protein
MSKTSSAVNLASYKTDVIFDDGVNQRTFTEFLIYNSAHTSIVKSVSPRNGDIFGGYNLTLTGVNLDVNTPTVNIDGIECVVKYVSSTSVKCLVG